MDIDFEFFAIDKRVLYIFFDDLSIPYDLLESQRQLGIILFVIVEFI